MTPPGDAHLSAAQELKRLENRINELSAFENEDELVLTGGTFQAPGGAEQNLSIGEAWPECAEGAVFRWQVTPPAHWPSRPLLLRLNVGGEGLVRVNGSLLGGINPYHREIEVQPGVPLLIGVEASPHDLFGTPSQDLRLKDAALLLPHEEVRALYAELQYVLMGLRALLARDRPGAAELLLGRLAPLIDSLILPRSPTNEYLARMTRSQRSRAENGSTFDAERFQVWERWKFDGPPLKLDGSYIQPLMRLRTDVQAAITELLPLVPPEGQLYLSGHAHLDLAWLWPLRETRRKALRTFSTVLSLMDRFPDFYYNQSMPQLYAWLEEDAPELFARVRARVQEGRWNLVGGMWVEPDGNLPSGESWARQLLYGQRYFASRFGHTARVAWLPDTFGYAGNLPQLFAQAGMGYFFTSKLIWNETSEFPHHLYRWEGLDGTQVTAHITSNPQHNYNGDVVPEQLLDTWRNFRGKRAHPESLFTFGFGDGGGGPTSEMLQRFAAFPAFPGLPKLRSGHINAFFESLPTTGLPVWVGEQYFEFHRGTYTSQGRIKRLHRQAEVTLVESEVASTLAHLLAGGPDLRTGLEADWKVLLLHQFHDILPGSSIRTVNQQAEGVLAGLVEVAVQRRNQALERLSAAVGNQDSLTVWNLSLQPRPLQLELPVPTGAVTVTHPDGAPVLQAVQDGRLQLSSPALVPAMGYLNLKIVASSPPAQSPLSASTAHLENEHLRAELGVDGSLSALYHKASGRQLLAGPGNVLSTHTDIPRAWEAWDVDAADMSRGGEVLRAKGPAEVRVNAVCAELKLRYEHEGARITQSYLLRAGSPRLDVHTHIVWTGRRTLLRASFPLNLRATSARYETAHGVVARPTHGNMPADAAQFEVPALRFADLSEGPVGFSLLNNGRHGHSVKHGVMTLSLLRSPLFPDPHADEGEHEFTYSLFPHADPTLANTYVQANDLNAPLLGVWGQGEREVRPSASYASVGHPGVQLSTLKLGEDGGLILRLAEGTGIRGELGLGGELGGSWEAVNLLEEPVTDSVSEVRPFQILSLRRELD
jgi:alpha-mannosidase